ncbi:hypothetical protein CAOG_05005 [Capsaspora owczarzaki ATCC 30864]|uniref:Uncharacterized protein n=1 Tax=Capsaspora owczarzaki (strain ATCC 30864) TaxID=595528 RepID=A0A0D2WR60_CAPO3|nr:hypothetical protein CAOG_05005 [Capsaspora owczarzaki ATCC 30864]KJE94347.1 hypothetical protein CAOG_005005 [Capsaspora owczarzaki ATCC 30864]KJE94348.1 hypothetical protein, variant 1 [Capsaspora owczarzaki ATCC 30864]KJE94349.1 hypothetical protein, variant 2 [Capsaspora owczarzaki ATCC 30864]KJE94350.1 hypothetical protein, variant 3 [Capsaspora owczarzaki ATCC 30864]|eukprot:XP_004346690.2 hypothetical protein CAOG_05005 [Capsaspora owczarzaki ATCC 30864]
MQEPSERPATTTTTTTTRETACRTKPSVFRSGSHEGGATKMDSVAGVPLFTTVSGRFKLCRGEFGLENSKLLWCTDCRRKKSCHYFHEIVGVLPTFLLHCTRAHLVAMGARVGVDAACISAARIAAETGPVVADRRQAEVSKLRALARNPGKNGKRREIEQLLSSCCVATGHCSMHGADSLAAPGDANPTSPSASAVSGGQTLPAGAARGIEALSDTPVKERVSSTARGPEGRSDTRAFRSSKRKLSFSEDDTPEGGLPETKRFSFGQPPPVSAANPAIRVSIAKSIANESTRKVGAATRYDLTRAHPFVFDRPTQPAPPPSAVQSTKTRPLALALLIGTAGGHQVHAEEPKSILPQNSESQWSTTATHCPSESEPLTVPAEATTDPEAVHANDATTTQQLPRPSTTRTTLTSPAVEQPCHKPGCSTGGNHRAIRRFAHSTPKRPLIRARTSPPSIKQLIEEASQPPLSHRVPSFEIARAATGTSLHRWVVELVTKSVDEHFERYSPRLRNTLRHFAHRRGATSGARSRGSEPPKRPEQPRHVPMHGVMLSYDDATSNVLDMMLDDPAMEDAAFLLATEIEVLPEPDLDVARTVSPTRASRNDNMILPSSLQRKQHAEVPDSQRDSALNTQSQRDFIGDYCDM